MTVPIAPFREDYTGNGVTTLWDYGWKVRDKSHLTVTKVLISSGSEETLVVDDDYTVNNVGDADGGTIDITPAISSLYRLAITPNMPVEQPTDLTTESRVPPDVAEDALDYIVGLIKQMAEQLNRAIKTTVGSALSPDEFIELIIGSVGAAEEAATEAGEARDDAVAAAAEAVGAVPGSIKVSANDTTQNYLLSKLVAGRAIVLTEQNNGGNENIKVDIDINTNTNFAGAPGDLTTSYFLMNYASVHWHVPYSGLLNGMNLLTQDTSPDMALDFLHLYDTSASTSKKVAPNDVNNMVLLASGAPTAVASVAFTNFVNAKYDRYILVVYNARPVTDAQDFNLETSYDDGVSYKTSYRIVSTGTVTKMNMFSNTGNAATNGIGAVIEIIANPDAAKYPWCRWQTWGLSNVGAIGGVSNSGVTLVAGVINALRISFASGNIATLNYKLYGVKGS